MEADIRVLVLHTSCCYLDEVRLLCGLERHPLFSGVEFHHALVDGLPCPYAAQLPRPIADNCATNNRAAFQLLASNGRRVHSLRDHAQAPVRTRFDSGTIEAPSMLDVRYRSLNLWEIVKCSAAATLQWESLRRTVSAGLSEHELATVKALMVDAVRHIEAMDLLLCAVQPTHCVLFNGFFHRERAAVELCQLHGVAAIAIESSTFRNFKHFSQSGMAGNRNDWALLGRNRVNVRAIMAAEKAQLDALMMDKLLGRGNFIQQAPRRGGARQRLCIPPDAKLAIFLGQVPHDSAITGDDLAFCDVLEAVELLIAQFGSELADVFLIIRLHPGGSVTSLRDDLLARRYANAALPANIRVVAGLSENTFDLMEIADVAITCSSQAGLEALWLRKPLVVLGNPYYAGKGFTRDVTDKESLTLALRSSLQAPLSQRHADQLEVFLYGLIFEYLVPISRDASTLTERGFQMMRNMLSGRHRLHGLVQPPLHDPDN